MKKFFLSLALLFIGFTANCQNTFYVNDNSTAGDVFTTALGSNANTGTATSPFATLQYAVNSAAANDVIYVDAGTYTGQVTIDKALTIIGAGQSLTFVTNSSQLVAPAGTFNEYALIQTTQGIDDVHISNLTATNGTPGNGHTIMIQTGGSVRNCKLVNGGQSVFFRIPDATLKTAITENNLLEPSGIGINCQGSGLTATIRNNTISRAASYYAGIFAGLDFGPLPQLTIQNNIINNFNGEGILAYSFNGTYTLNSITGTATNAINRNGNGGNTPIATCNWFGTSNAATIASKIVGTVIYSPFLAIGTDGSSNVGFQPAGSCGSSNTYYVNDGSTTGDIFTSAIGSDANVGTATAPFATLQFAVNTAAANDIIYVDAGTYTEQVTITKGINIIGAGQNVTSILKPAITVAPPGPFTEQGVIQTAQNIGDVNIKDLSVTGDYTVGVTPLIIQSAGSVRNCKLQGGNQGLFVRIDAATNPGAKTFYIEGNTILAEYIAVNVAGTSLHAILSNNTLAANNPGFSAGMFAGQDFGPLGRLTATNNLFSTYYSSGIQISASNASITQNAFTGTGALAINRTGVANITANCNWYGVANAAAIVPKINAGVNYYPWYVDGTDASTVAGFQHYTESCSATTNVYYVNDNSTTGNVFTTVVGNDANTGTSPTSPLATFGAALTKASPGAVIYMDAGTYTAQDATIDKQVQVVGTNFNVLPNSAADPLLLNGTRNAETIIENTNWIIGANSIYFDGLTFNPLGKQAITLNNTTWGDTRLLRNRLRISSNLTQLNFTGSGTTTMALSAIANWNLNIRENRFEKEDVNFGTTLLVSRYGSVNISNNSFVVTGTTVRSQTAINAGSSGVVNYLYIANNTFDRPSVAINSSRLAIANINFNKFINTSNAFFGSNPIPESSEVGFRYNTLDGSAGFFPFINYNRSGGNAVGASSSVTAEENTMTGTAVVGTNTLVGSMNLAFFNTVLSPSLTVRNNKMTYSGDLSTVQGQNIRPIVLRGNLANAIVEKNEISLNGTNLQPRNPAINLPDSPAITLYTDNGTTSFLQSGSVINILNNKINGFKQSFAAYDDRAGNDAFIGYGNIPAGVTVNVNNNSFTGDLMSINNGTNSTEINASCNWYGSAAVQNIINKVSLQTGTYVPFLTNGTDNDASTGFQPISDSCNGLAISATFDAFSNVTCNRANNGTINITVTNGVVPYTFAWNKDNDPAIISTNEDPTNLAPGIYHVIVTDASGTNILVDNDGNIYTIDVTITEPTLLTASADGTNNLCNGQLNGTASVTAGGGSAPYTYLWSNGATSSSISSLVAAIYNVTVTDANGCTKTALYEVTQPSILIASANGTNVSCFNGSNGSASVTAGGGSVPYTYLWSNGATSSSISSLVAGIYNVTVTDANGCTKTASYEVTQPTLLTASANGTNVSCFNGSNGSASVTPGGGTAPYTYLWSNVETTQNISNLTTGTYNVTVTDANGCTKTASYEVTQPFLLTASIANNSNACSNNATVTALAGTPLYTYLWSNGATTASINNVPVGTYNVTVKDANECSTTASITLTVGEAFNPSASVTDVSCFGGSNGAITVTNANGTAPFKFSIDGLTFLSGTFPYSFNSLSAGTYNIAVKDANGCTGFVTKTITQPPLLTVTTSSIQRTCFGQNTGAISITVSGGSGAKTYNWTGPNGYTSIAQNLTGLSSGNYSLLVTDAKGCIAILNNVIVASFSEIIVASSVTNVLCRASLTGAINLTVSGGTGSGFTFSWTGITTSTSEDISNLGSGTNYKVTITDIGSGCTVSKTYIISQPASNLAISRTKTNAAECNSLGTITMTGSGGTAGYLYSIDGTNYQVANTFSGLLAGSYTAWVKDANGCTKSSALISIIDNGGDAYESNNSKNQAKLVSIGTTINARIATATDVADWFKFTTPAGNGNYNLNLSHATVNYTFNMYPSANNAAALVPTSSTSASKQYALTGGTTYFVQITGGLSFSCYNLSVSTVTSPAKYASTNTKVIAIDKLTVKAYPNPHKGLFNLSIISSEVGKAQIELFSILGQLLAKREVSIEKGQNTIVEFNDVGHGMILYHITIGNQEVNGKVYGKD